MGSALVDSGTHAVWFGITSLCHGLMSGLQSHSVQNNRGAWNLLQGRLSSSRDRRDALRVSGRKGHPIPGLYRDGQVCRCQPSDDHSHCHLAPCVVVSDSRRRSGYNHTHQRPQCRPEGGEVAPATYQRSLHARAQQAWPSSWQLASAKGIGCRDVVIGYDEDEHKHEDNPSQVHEIFLAWIEAFAPKSFDGDEEQAATIQTGKGQ